MTAFDESRDPVRCSFCGKSHKQVAKVIAGPGVYICNECITLCNDIIAEELFVGADGSIGWSDRDGAVGADGDAAVFEAWGRLTGRLGRSPTVAELAADLGVGEDNVTDILRRASRGRQAAQADPSEVMSVPVALRAFQHQLRSLSEQLAVLVEESNATTSRSIL